MLIKKIFNPLAIIVFITGFVVTALEILGSRILAPLTGVTVAVWSSIIMVILIAIGLGYFVGGALVDKHKSRRVISSLLSLSSLAIFMLLWLKNQSFSLLFIGQNPSYRLIALILSGLFFALPGFLLGIINSYTIKFSISSDKLIGPIHGLLYGIATMGSILGVFLTGYFLVPNFSVSVILIILGFALILGAILGEFIKEDKI